MSMLCKVNGIPVFYNIEDAVSFGSTFGLKGVHTHVHDGRTGYMPGSNHMTALRTIKYPKPIKPSKEKQENLEKWADSSSLDPKQPGLIFPKTTTIFEEPDDEFNLPPTSGGGY